MNSTRRGTPEQLSHPRTSRSLCSVRLTTLRLALHQMSRLHIVPPPSRTIWFTLLSANLVGIAEMRNATEGVPYRFWTISVGNGLRAVPLRGRGNKIRRERLQAFTGAHYRAGRVAIMDMEVQRLADFAGIFAGAGPATLWAYIDPGSGGLMLQLLLGGIGGVFVACRLYWRRIVSKFRPEPTASETVVGESAPTTGVAAASGKKDDAEQRRAA